jgi:hypothetical protein
MTNDTIWKVVKRDDDSCVTPLRFQDKLTAEKWVTRNQPLFKEEIVAKLFFIGDEPMFIQDTHGKFMNAVTGENALTK